MHIFTSALRTIIFISFLFLFVVLSVSKAQNLNTDKFKYLFPVPNSKLNSTESNIIIRYDKPFKNYGSENNLVVKGNKSGVHKGKIVLTENDRTLIFKPEYKFADDETVTVEIIKGLETLSNKQIPSLRYSFETSKVNLNKEIKSDQKKSFQPLSSEVNFYSDQSLQKSNSNSKIFNWVNSTIQHDSLPNDFPQLVVDSIDNPTPGFIFFTPFGMPNFLPNYLIITDNYGVPVFYRKMKNAAFDFKKVNDSTLAYFDYGKVFQHYLLNSSYDIVDSISLQNGYPTD